MSVPWCGIQKHPSHKTSKISKKWREKGRKIYQSMKFNKREILSIGTQWLVILSIGLIPYFMLGGFKKSPAEVYAANFNLNGVIDSMGWEDNVRYISVENRRYYLPSNTEFVKAFEHQFEINDRVFKKKGEFEFLLIKYEVDTVRLPFLSQSLYYLGIDDDYLKNRFK